MEVLALRHFQQASHSCQPKDYQDVPVEPLLVYRPNQNAAKVPRSFAFPVRFGIV